MVINLHAEAGVSATFTDSGDLVSFCCRGGHWGLSGPSPCCGVVVAEPDLGRRILTPPAGSGEVVRRDSESIEVVFRDVVDAEGNSVAVCLRVRWRPTGEVLSGTISLEAAPADLVLHALVFPDLALAVSERGRLILPRLEGVIIDDAGARIHRGSSAVSYSYAYPGQVSMQCLGWSEGDHGFYLDSRDANGWSKRVLVQGEEAGAARFRVWHLAPRERRPKGAFDVPYPISLSAFDGTWFDVARIYRRWALTVPFAARGPEKRRRTWIGDLACWVWNRGRIADVCPPVKELARRIELPVALDWYWWHKHGYDTEYPDYFPPREGHEAFTAAVRDLREHDVYTQVYTNGIGYDMDGGTWLPDGPECAIQLENGETKAVAFNVYTGHRLAFGCGGSERWRNKIRGFVRQALELGLDGLYIDMVSNVAGGYPCFHPGHGHTPGGGHYQIDGFRQLWLELRNRHPGVPFSTEAPAEVFMDLVDAFITINTSNERLGGAYGPIQLWNAVYHGRAVCFGNYALVDGIPPFDELWPREYRRKPADERDWHALCPDQFAIELARTLVGGVQPMVANLKTEHFDNPTFADDILFLVDIARFYHAHREWLLWGEMLPPGTLECETRPVSFLQRMIFTAPGKERILTKPQPTVLHSAWRAPSGEAMAILVNYTTERQCVRYRCPAGMGPGAPLSEGLKVSRGGSVHGTVPPRTCLALALE